MMKLKTVFKTVAQTKTVKQFICNEAGSVWQPRHAASRSTNWQRSLLCCCTASMEQATDKAETAAINRLVVI